MRTGNTGRELALANTGNVLGCGVFFGTTWKRLDRHSHRPARCETPHRPKRFSRISG
nr:MAG TPA_asm: hypothetical protein [Caudoviricetes sp.]